jgi:hypothetical protein
VPLGLLFGFVSWHRSWRWQVVKSIDCRAHPTSSRHPWHVHALVEGTVNMVQSCRKTSTGTHLSWPAIKIHEWRSQGLGWRPDLTNDIVHVWQRPPSCECKHARHVHQAYLYCRAVPSNLVGRSAFSTYYIFCLFTLIPSTPWKADLENVAISSFLNLKMLLGTFLSQCQQIPTR